MAKVMISLPDDALRRIDERAAEQGTSRSAWLLALAERELSKPSREEMLAIIERSRARFAHTPSTDATAEIRKDRDSRR